MTNLEKKETKEAKEKGYVIDRAEILMMGITSGLSKARLGSSVEGEYLNEKIKKLNAWIEEVATIVSLEN